MGNKKAEKVGQGDLKPEEVDLRGSRLVTDSGRKDGTLGGRVKK